jgi:hypothetical protein
MFKVEETEKLIQFKYGREMAHQLKDGKFFTWTRKKREREVVQMNNLALKSTSHL